MRKIRLTSAEPGMILAKPIENEKGITLCGAGTALTETLIERFTKMEIETILVEGYESMDPAKASWVKKLIEERFSRAETCPVCNDIKQILIERLEKRLG